MIIPDVNILVYAYNSASRYHENARNWLEETLAGAPVRSASHGRSDSVLYSSSPTSVFF
jgi:hypothetical protein